ncbi:filamentous hemagglutinin N-terminal domain-containing protein [Candidatus Albibeggiatoa sp. nov. BB20]|uniref:two-partner secretion domain-containing protein n=1 Tax=Candidatus Albibeggiatoa sp. nov. BB20 TaxID=3162723 RepID=UPI0033657C08
MQYFIILCLLFSTSLHAEVILDGSLGQRVELTGSHYEITESLGSRAGNNLFHSFESFNLSEGDVATFSGSADIYNVISRVTGGESSLIDGTIASTMPEAFFYFINPYGVAFGPNSSLDVAGSFHTSTAHILRFLDGNDFDTVNTENTLLSIEEPSAFGFLSDNVAPISLQQAKLKVANFRTLSFIGNQPTFSSSIISAGIGQIYVIGIDGKGEVGFKTNFISSTEFFSEFDIQAEKLADINIQRSLLSVSGAKGGNVYIRGGHVISEASRISAETGNYNGGVIDIRAQDISLQAGTELIANSRGSGGLTNINLTAENNITISGETIRQDTVIPSSLTLQVDDAESGNIQLKAKNIQLLDGGNLFASSWESGQGGNIILEAAERIDISGTTSQGVGSQIGANSRGEEVNAGNGGTIQLNAQSVFITDGAQVGSLTVGYGDGGQLSIQATKELTVTGQAERIDGNVIPTRLTAITTQAGQGGNIQIETAELNLQDNAQIAASSVGTGNGGTVSIQAQNVTLSSTSPDKQAGSIIANSRGDVENAGRGGNIEVQTENLTVLDGGQLTSSVTGTGHGGNISLEVAQTALFSGTDPNQQFSSGILSLTTQSSTGDAGTIQLKSTGVLLDDNAQINAQTRGAGLGGDITIQAQGFVAQREGRVTAQSLGTGDAGSLILDIANTLVLNQGSIQTSTEIADGGNVIVDVGNYLFIRQGELSTSVGADVGNGGNITLNSKFTILHDSPIIARAFGGNGGNINIVTRSLYKMEPNFLSPIDASSRFGLDGVITISTPDVGSDEGLLVLPESFVRADVILPKSCGSDVLQSSFVLQDKVGITPLQSDWQPAHF